MKWKATTLLLALLLMLDDAASVESNDASYSESHQKEIGGGGDGLTMTEVRSAIRRAMARDILSVNASGTTLTNPIVDFTETYDVGTSCHDIVEKQGASQSGLYLIHPPNIVQGPWKVYCDQESDGGGWTVFQVRDDVEPHENFMRNWEDYKVGFGDFDREFWLGNILLWALTNTNDDKKYELAVDLEDWSGNKRFARYKGFRVGPESDQYRLYFKAMHLGNAGDSLFSHNGLPFSTFDVDNDSREGPDFAERNCARLYKGGWWYGNCHDSNLNGWYLGGPHRSFADGVNWFTWTGYNYSLRRTLMRFRPIKPENDGYGTPSTSYGPPPPPSTGYGVPSKGYGPPPSPVALTPLSDSYLEAHKHSHSPIKGFRGLHRTPTEDPTSTLESDINTLSKP